MTTTKTNDFPLVTLGLLVACVVVFVLAESDGSTLEASTLLQWGASERSAVWGAEPWRLFTSMFLHIGVVHLLWNAWGLFAWCRPLELALGRLPFLAVYLACGVVASSVSVLGHDALAAGASGAGFGVIGVSLAFSIVRLGSVKAWLGDEPTKKTLANLAMWFVVGAFMGFDNFAHGGGLVFGLLLGRAIASSSTRRRAAGISAALIAGALVVVAATHRWPGQHSLTETRARYDEADARLRANDFAGAKAILDDALRFGDESFLLFQRSYAVWQLGDLAAAERDLDRALLLAPDDVAGHENRGLLREARGDTAGALDDFNAALRVNPASVVARDGGARLRAPTTPSAVP